jgi:hypothetical protein
MGHPALVDRFRAAEAFYPGVRGGKSTPIGSGGQPAKPNLRAHFLFKIVPLAG